MKQHKHHLALAVAAACVLAGAWTAPAHARINKSAQEIRKQKMAEIPICTKKIGTITIEEPEAGVSLFGQYQLPSPTKLIKVIVNKSRCFTLVDRNAGMGAAMRERALASGGELHSRSNIGKGQIKAADYVMVPDLISTNSDAGGNAITGVLGGLIGGGAGNLVGNLAFKKKTADVVLTVTDVRTSEQVAMAEGNAKKTDIGFGASSGMWGNGGFGGAGIGGYANTEIGQVITMAYVNAFADLVTQLGGVTSTASNAQQAVTLLRPARLLREPNGNKSVRNLDAGMLLYPTGSKQGVMWQVQDELGNTGWVSSEAIKLAS